jgi:hypothetical protein
MEHVMKIEKRVGVDVGYHQDNVHPVDGEGRVGRNGFDKTLELHEVIKIASRIEPRPNIVVKSGKNAKWYLKSFSKNKIESEIEKQQWRDTTRFTMWIIDWD